MELIRSDADAEQFHLCVSTTLLTSSLAITLAVLVVLGGETAFAGVSLLEIIPRAFVFSALCPWGRQSRSISLIARAVTLNARPLLSRGLPDIHQVHLSLEPAADAAKRASWIAPRSASFGIELATHSLPSQPRPALARSSSGSAP